MMVKMTMIVNKMMTMSEDEDEDEVYDDIDNGVGDVERLKSDDDK